FCFSICCVFFLFKTIIIKITITATAIAGITNKNNNQSHEGLNSGFSSFLRITSEQSSPEYPSTQLQLFGVLQTPFPEQTVISSDRTPLHIVILHSSENQFS